MGTISETYAKKIIQGYAKVNRDSVAKTASKPELIEIAKNPKKGIEQKHKNRVYIEYNADPITKNRVIINRHPNGRIRINVIPNKK